MQLTKLQKLFASLFIDFTKKLFDEGEEQVNPMLEEQKKDRDNLLTEIAKVILTYKVIDTAMDLTNSQFTSEKNRFDKMVSSMFLNQYKSEQWQITDILTGVAKDKYNSNNFLYGLDKLKSKKLPTSELRKVISGTIDGKNYGKRLEENKDKIAKTLQNEVKKFLQGKTNVNDIESIIKDKFNTNAYETHRLVTTEIARVQNQVSEKWNNDNGIKQVIFSATLDNRTSERCRSLEDKVFDVNDPKKPTPPLHPNCRSTLIPITPNGYKPNINSNWSDFKKYSNQD
jgi:SPP1 gp7 family putative phage head morphogenesis protein